MHSCSIKVLIHLNNNKIITKNILWISNTELHTNYWLLQPLLLGNNETQMFGLRQDKLIAPSCLSDVSHHLPHPKLTSEHYASFVS